MYLINEDSDTDVTQDTSILESPRFDHESFERDFNYQILRCILGHLYGQCLTRQSKEHITSLLLKIIAEW